MRLFIAISPSEEAVRVLADARERLRSAASAGRFVSDAQLHVTLKFLGETREDALPGIIKAIERAAARSIARIRLCLGGMGAFGRDGGRVVYCGLTGEVDKLAALHADLDVELHALGFERELRRYTPHFTLGRDVRGYEPLPVSAVPFTAVSMTLFRSDLSGAAPRYTPLHEQTLG